MSQGFRKMLAKPARDIRMMIGRGIVRLVTEADGLQHLQVDGLADETLDGVEHAQDYGFASSPLPGAIGLLLAIAGRRGQAVAVGVGDRRYRIALEKGEVAIHDDQGQKVHLTRDGIVIETSKALSVTAGEALSLTAPSLTADIEGAIAFTCETFTLEADTATLTVDTALNLGGTGGLQAARKTDAIAGGAITGGSTKVRIT